MRTSIINLSFLLIFIYSISISNKLQAQTCNNVTTYAGTGNNDLNNGNISVAEFNKPRSIAFDQAGNMYIADGDNNSIRKITTSGVVSVFAGSPTGNAGYMDGLGTAAIFDTPADLVFDQSDNLYVADARNNRIRKITPSGVVTTFAGNGTFNNTFLGGIGTGARVSGPQFIKIDNLGNLYVSTSRNRILKITTDAVVRLLAGSSKGNRGDVDATGSAARFDDAAGLAFGPDDNLYVADIGNHKIKKITPNGVVTTYLGSGQDDTIDETGTLAAFEYPRSLAFSCDGDLYIGQGSSEYSSSFRAVRKATPNGMVTTLAGGSDDGDIDGIGNAVELEDPRGLAFDENGNLFFADLSNHKIKQIATCENGCTKVKVIKFIPSSSQWSMFIYGLLIMNLGVYYVLKLEKLIA